ncbi:pilus assembly protein [Pseudoxanthomonas broegbernensis]|uniref:Type II secretion system protein H n=1 Tax=Pseudoxanthomonas broegbernensis TaxID=83619 RepID=A0A7V8GM60_9GAMM|nr:Tfp pilus assembly protein FimT/FimU [Pseudoxanthomonas broegbernensis]KAF1686163.1 pilus assembly protein [Pseudoxanthomonas broegbernensis]MBB6063869.1 type IV fimbrial biogenesis protein FimT [Pseudoxanthomonas broegbernensis]
MRKDAPGFTLIECLTVIAVVALLYGLALPGFQEALRRQHIATAMHLVSAQLAQARNTAITQRVPVTLCPSRGDGRCRDDPDWSAGWLLYRDPRRGNQPLAAADILRDVRQPLPGSVQVRSSAGRQRVRYQPDGRSGGSNLTLQVCHGPVLGGEIIVNNVGRVRTRRPPAGSACTGN